MSVNEAVWEKRLLVRDTYENRNILRGMCIHTVILGALTGYKFTAQAYIELTRVSGLAAGRTVIVPNEFVITDEEFAALALAPDVNVYRMLYKEIYDEYSSREASNAYHIE